MYHKISSSGSRGEVLWTAVQLEVSGGWESIKLCREDGYCVWAKVRNGHWPDQTWAYFCPAVNKGPTQLWPKYFTPELKRFVLIRCYKNGVFLRKFFLTHLDPTWAAKILHPRVLNFWVKLFSFTSLHINHMWSFNITFVTQQHTFCKNRKTQVR